MKKLFIFVLLIPFLVFAEDPYPTGRNPSTGSDQNYVTPTDKRLAEGRATSPGTGEPVCPMCVTTKLLGDNTAATPGGAQKETETAPTKTGN